MPTPSRRLVVAVVLAFFALGACSAGSAGGSAGGANGVSIVDFNFSPTTLTVAAGTTVTWTNTGGATHTVTADDGSFDSGDVSSGSSFSRMFSTAGTLAYHCSIHSSMHGTITVTG